MYRVRNLPGGLAAIGWLSLGLAATALASPALAAPAQASPAQASPAQASPAQASFAPPFDQPFEQMAAELARAHLFDDSIGAIRTQSAQVRARQLRIREARQAHNLPLVDSTLTIADDRLSAPLRLRDAGRPPGARIAPSAVRRLNTYLAGRLYSSESGPATSDLTTGGVTVGADYGFSDELLLGVALTRLHGDYSSGQAVAAYLSLEPVDEVFVDVSASTGSYDSRATLTEPFTRAVASGQTQGYSVQITHARRFGTWSISPFSRYEWVETSGRYGAGAGAGAGVGLKSRTVFSIGGLLTTSVGTPVGTVYPRILVELQREAALAGDPGLVSGTARQGLVGVGLTTRLTREVSAFAESRLRQEQGLAESSEKRALVGVRMRF